MTHNTEWVYGLHAVNALLRHGPEVIIQLYFLEGRGDERLGELRQAALALNIPHQLSTRAELDRKVDGAHQGVAALCKAFRREKNEAFLAGLLDKLPHAPL